MVQQLPKSNIVYPDSDGQPMADNTKQFRWIVTIKDNLELLFADDGDVFVAGDLLWYPVQGNPKIRQAPDVLVAFGRPKGDRGSYQQWREDDIAPQVVFEILSPGNRLGEMVRKLGFYNRYGVEEYYIYNPDTVDFTGLLRADEGLTVIEELQGWVSPNLGVRFQQTPETLEIYRPDGEKFLTYVELGAQRETERQRAETERQRAEAAEAELEAQKERIAALEAQLKAMGIEPGKD